MKSCPVCGRSYPMENFCEVCGVALTENNTQNNSSYNEDKTVGYMDYGNNVNHYGTTENQSYNNPYGVPENMNYNDYNGSNVEGNSSGGDKSSAKAIIIVLAVLLFIAISVAAIFMFESFDSDKKTAGPPVNNVYQQETTTVIIPETTTVPETTTKIPETTAQMPVFVPSKEDAFDAFNSFYVSYIDAINLLDASYLNHCSISVRREMEERFEINKKSLFDLRRIDVDLNSVTVLKNGDKTEYNFYVKCVTMLYDRVTYEEKNLNYSVWLVTVTAENGNYAVTDMERDDKHVISSNVTTFSDNVSLF